ncbi:MAG TPA: hypothetical protein VD833_14865 [Vicinamibacterales bacterium]|nr:hypothetical protein [Vicinamibacterales bacterium]
MTLDAFEASLANPVPPSGLTPLLEALWHERRGNWARAHELAQAIEDVAGARVHAYLHRREGDLANAGYWYRRAARRAETGPLDEEWRAIVVDLLGL